LPSACLDELAALENSFSAGSGLAGSSSASESRPQSGRDNELRVLPDPAYPSRVDREYAIAEVPARLPGGSDAAAHPIAAVQSAEWNPPAAQPLRQAPAARPIHTATLPVTVEEPVPSESLDSLKAVDVLDLMRRLRSDVETMRAPARRELLRRGFSEVDLELARQLFSPDVAARKQLALAVPRLASVDAARWLMWLAADPQPEVRIAAITTLATTGDPALLARVEGLARSDSDEQVKAIADQIAKQRDLANSRGSANPLR
jgi:hypothetical protein